MGLVLDWYSISPAAPHEKASGIIQHADLLAAGDWNNDGVTEIGVFRPGTGRWYLDQNAKNQWDGCSLDGCHAFGTNGDRPVAGMWLSGYRWAGWKTVPITLSLARPADYFEGTFERSVMHSLDGEKPAQ